MKKSAKTSTGVGPSVGHLDLGSLYDIPPSLCSKFGYSEQLKGHFCRTCASNIDFSGGQKRGTNIVVGSVPEFDLASEWVKRGNQA